MSVHPYTHIPINPKSRGPVDRYILMMVSSQSMSQSPTQPRVLLTATIGIYVRRRGSNVKQILRFDVLEDQMETGLVMWFVVCGQIG